MSNPALAARLVVPFEELRMTDVDVVGGKNASLGEMISQLAATGVRVPGGFATTAHAFREFLEFGGLTITHPWIRIGIHGHTFFNSGGTQLGQEIQTLDRRGNVVSKTDLAGNVGSSPPVTITLFSKNPRKLLLPRIWA